MDRLMSYVSLVSTTFLSSATLTSPADTIMLDIEAESTRTRQLVFGKDLEGIFSPMAYFDTDLVGTFDLESPSSSSSLSPHSGTASITSPYSDGSADLCKDCVVTNGPDVDIASLKITKKSSKISVVSRQQKTLAEKQRRDKLNDCFRNLTLLVPTVATAKKRIDKSSVLRLSASYLRFHKGLANGLVRSNGWRPRFSDSKEWKKILLEATGGFLMLVNETCHVVYVTDEIRNVLGHAVVDVLGRSIYSVVHPDDQDAFESQVKSMKDAGAPSYTVQPSSARCDFFCSMLVHSTGDVQSPDQYDLVHVVGNLKAVDTMKNGVRAVQKLYTFVVKPCIMSPTDGVSLERRLGTYFLKASLDGHLLFSDHWFSTILGHLPSELIGISGLDFVFDDDVLLSLMAHRHLLFQDGMTVIPLRLITRTNCPIFVIAASKLVHTDDVSDEDTVLINMKTISNKEGERALAVVKRHLCITGSHLDSFASITSDKTIIGDNLNMALGFNTRRPRGRPRKHPVNQLGFNETLPQPSLNAFHQGDVCMEVVKWAESYKAGLKSTTDMRTACKEIVEHNAKVYNRYIKCSIPRTGCATAQENACKKHFNEEIKVIDDPTYAFDHENSDIGLDAMLESSLKRKSIGVSRSNVVKHCHTSEILSL